MGKSRHYGFWNDDFDEELSKLNSYREYLHINSQTGFEIILN